MFFWDNVWSWVKSLFWYSVTCLVTPTLAILSIVTCAVGGGWGLWALLLIVPWGFIIAILMALADEYA